MNQATDTNSLHKPTLHRVSVHEQRVELMLKVAGVVIIIGSLFWGIYFTMRGYWGLVLSDVALSVVGFITIVLAREKRFLLATLVALTVLTLDQAMLSLLVDVPTQEAPRSAHMYYLPMCVFALVALRDESMWLRRGVPSLCLLLFGVFAASPLVSPGPLQLDPDIRVFGSWFNSTLAITTAIILLNIWQTDISPYREKEAEIAKALTNNEFVLFLQPQIDANLRIVGGEALVRWRHPQRGLIMPGEFIPMAEKTGQINDLGHWVMREACRILSTWSNDPELSRVVLSINVSAAQMTQPDFVSDVMSCLTEFNVAPGSLRLELTESMLVKDVDGIAKKMAQLQAHGLTLSLDDFGTGFSSLSYLKRLPLNELKIDKSFVHDMEVDTSHATLVDSMLQMGMSLGLQITAEGVETQAQWEYLRDRGCHLFQGYWFSPPCALDVFEAKARQVCDPRELQSS